MNDACRRVFANGKAQVDEIAQRTMIENSDVGLVWKQRGKPRRKKGRKEAKENKTKKEREEKQAFAWLVCDARFSPEVE